MVGLELWVEDESEVIVGKLHSVHRYIVVKVVVLSMEGKS